MASRMSADEIGRVAQVDLQFTVPTHPVVRRGVRLRPTGEGVVLDGAPRSQLFRGAFAAEHLLGLAEACDGTADHATIATRLGLGERAVSSAVALLWTAGAVEEAPGQDPASPPDGVASEVACLLSRLGDSTGANASWREAADRLARARVRVDGDPAVARELGSVLADHCTVVDDGGAPSAGEVVVFVETPGSADRLATVRDRAWAEGVPLVRVRLDARRLVVGPYVDPALTPCLDCARAGEAPAVEDGPSGRQDLAVGLVARELVALLGRAMSSHLPGDSCERDLRDLTARYLPAATRPGCPTCGGSRGPLSPTPPLATRYEAAVAIPPRAFIDAKGHQAHYRSSNLELQHSFRAWPSCPRTELPAPDLDRLATRRPGDPVPPAAAATPTTGQLATLLAIACGLRPDRAGPGAGGGKLRRWTAAGGNLGSVTAYVAVRDPDLLEPGTYAYLERDHRLARVGDEVPPGASPVTLVLTGNVGKVAAKYGAFALRIALQDSGVALTSLREVAAALGVRLDLGVDWDDLALHRACGTTPSQEPVTAVVDLGGRREN